eukprot:scpid90829/ scgid3876/ 
MPSFGLDGRVQRVAAISSSTWGLLDVQGVRSLDSATDVLHSPHIPVPTSGEAPTLKPSLLLKCCEDTGFVCVDWQSQEISTRRIQDHKLGTIPCSHACGSLIIKQGSTYELHRAHTAPPVTAVVDQGVLDSHGNQVLPKLSRVLRCGVRTRPYTSLSSATAVAAAEPYTGERV